ncbi:amidohydrolase family protein [Methylocapsa sp. S129]|uniref:amidohydrolase family protein n=1 Tax=Methylocapsa sp. S129 TaxID=1641869 RepID=UPI00131DA36A|nr:amidohydrolase family protein [Methylocapsa sp. S129]
MQAEVDRRTLLKSAALAAAGSGGAGAAAAQSAQNSAGAERPKTTAPAGATDSHIHIYDSRFTAASNAALRPPDASVDEYRLLQQRLGVSRVVVVQPSTYGTDNSCTLDAVAQFGPTVARGVAVVDTSVTDAELRRLDAHGVRAIRFNLVMRGGTTTVDMLEPLSKRVHELDWHVQIHMTADQIAQSEDLFTRLASPLLFDHRGRIPPEAGVRHPAYAVLRKLLDAGRTWVKLSSAYQDSKLGPPTYADIAPVAKAFAQAAPERMLWGSDWPHPTEKAGDKPDDAILFDLLADWTPEPSARQRILVDNPAELFGFPGRG